MKIVNPKLMVLKWYVFVVAIWTIDLDLLVL
jgi:hypothetical protein